jgi:hypothetical protein
MPLGKQITHLNCALYGGKFFLIAALAPAAVYIPFNALTRFQELTHVLLFLYIAGPLAWIIGAILGRRIYANIASMERTVPIQMPGLFYVVATLLLSVLAYGLSLFGGMNVDCLVVGYLFTLLACDACLIHRLTALHKKGMLAPPNTQKFQFSLLTFMSVILATSTWVTGLVMILR